MISHGDELGRTQQGNNNVYCQDNELSWVDWDLDETQAELLAFTRRVVRLRTEHPVFRRRRFFAGAPEHGGESELRDIAWFSPEGEHMRDDEWNNSLARAVMVFLNGDAIIEPDERGQDVVDDSFLVLFNGQPTRRRSRSPTRSTARRGPPCSTPTPRSTPVTRRTPARSSSWPGTRW